MERPRNPDESRAGIVLFVPRQARGPEHKLYFGLDLGQRRDHSALVAVQLGWEALGQCPVTFAQRFRPELEIRSLDRFPLGTCYDGLSGVVLDRVAEAAGACASAPDQHLIIDAGGPGPPVVDRLRKIAPASLNVHPVIITGGKGVNSLSGGYTGIPRRTLVSTVLYAIGAASLRCVPGLAGWDNLVEELVMLRAGDTQPEDQGAHDDVVMALALAVHAAVRDTPEILPEPRDARRAARTFGYVNRPLF
ncbi:MAG TPA: hypothetical protein VFQ91_00555 [Bryobacteraceae bacterium]|nr:hypothetical protein [Bryobacteraceae bacterium]